MEEDLKFKGIPDASLLTLTGAAFRASPELCVSEQAWVGSPVTFSGGVGAFIKARPCQAGCKCSGTSLGL